MKKRILNTNRREKENIFYSVCLNAWKETKMETDKSLLTLSTSAVGLLLTLLTAIGANNLLEIILFICAISLFIITIFITLFIFEKNAEYLKNVIKGESTSTILKNFDRIKKITFLFGILLAFGIGISSIIHNNYKDKKMETRNNTTKQQNDFGKRSLDGIDKLRPTPAKQPKQDNNKTPKKEEKK